MQSISRRSALLLAPLLLPLVGCRAPPRPTPTPTTTFVGKIDEVATPMGTYQARLVEVDPESSRKLEQPVPVYAEPGGRDIVFRAQPGARVLINGSRVVGGRTYYRIRSTDGLQRGWIGEAWIVEGDRPR